MGYGLGLAFFGLCFTVSTLALTMNISSNGGLNWVSQQGGTRTLLVIFGWIAFAVAAFFCAALKWEDHGEFPRFISWIASHGGDIWLPLFMLVPAFVFLDSERSVQFSTVAQIILKVGFALNILISVGILYGWMKASERNMDAAHAYTQKRDNERHNEHLKFIAEQKPTDAIVNLMALTGRFHDQDVREAAVAKVKSKPDWEAKLLELLDNEHYHTEAYSFIDGNDVDHPALFVAPLNRSILRVAQEIKKRIKDSNDLQDWHFDHFSIERLLRAIDEQFSEVGDFKPALLELRAALDTPKPERFKTVRFNITPILDRWLKAH